MKQLIRIAKFGIWISFIMFTSCKKEEPSQEIVNQPPVNYAFGHGFTISVGGNSITANSGGYVYVDGVMYEPGICNSVLQGGNFDFIANTNYNYKVVHGLSVLWEGDIKFLNDGSLIFVNTPVNGVESNLTNSQCSGSNMPIIAYFD